MTRAMKDSGIEWLGEIPADWEISKVKHYYKMQTGFTPDTKKEEFYDDVNGHDWVNISDIHDGKIITETKKKISQLYIDNFFPVQIPAGSLLYSFNLSVGQTAFAGKPLYSNEAIASFLPSENINLHFLRYSSLMIEENAEVNIYNARILNRERINNAYIIFPPLDEQQRIAAFLDGKCARIDSVVEKTRASIEEYRKLKQSIITRAVTKGIRPNRPTKDSGVEWLGQIPESYDVRRIKYLGSYRNGLTYTPNELVDETEGTLVLRSSNIQQGQLCFTDNVYVKTDIPDRLLVQKGDIIICSRNGSRDLIGKCAIVENDMVASFGAFMMIFRCVAPKYMYYILNSDVFKYYLSTFRTSTINQLTSENFGNMEIVWCADKTEQKEIAAYLDEKTAAIDSLVAKKNQLVTELASLKKSLIFEYVTGKKEVPK